MLEQLIENGLREYCLFGNEDFRLVEKNSIC